MNDDAGGAGNERKGFSYSLSGMVLISTYFITGKYALGSFNVETFCFVWISATAALTLVLVLLRGGLRSLRLPRGVVGAVAGLGLSTGVGLILLYSGLKLIDPSFSAFLARSLPVMVILLGVVFLKERLGLIEILPMVLMLAGGVVSVWGRWEAVGMGVVLTLLGHAAFAFQRLFAKMGSSRVSALVLIFYRGAIAWVVVGVWLLMSRRADFHVEARYWWVCLIGALLSPVLGNLLSFHSYKYWSLSRNALLLMIQPLLVLPMAYVFLEQLPTARELAGGALILVGALWITWIHLPKSNGPPAPPDPDRLRP